MTVLFITGIDTDIGKTIATAKLAKILYQNGHNIITQKLVQTGCDGISEDIITHRQMMGMPLQAVDKEGTTCPYVFTKPASPHLSSALENATIYPKQITDATNTLLKTYDTVLLEGAGGLLVPMTDELLTLDYIASQGYPIVLVTSGRLGSINHTLLSIEAIERRGLTLHAVIYNHWQPNDDDTRYKNAVYQKDEQITDSTRDYLLNYLIVNHPNTYFVDLPDGFDNTHLQKGDIDSRLSLAEYAGVLVSD